VPLGGVHIPGRVLRPHEGVARPHERDAFRPMDPSIVVPDHICRRFRTARISPRLSRLSTPGGGLRPGSRPTGRGQVDSLFLWHASVRGAHRNGWLSIGPRTIIRPLQPNECRFPAFGMSFRIQPVVAQFEDCRLLPIGVESHRKLRHVTVSSKAALTHKWFRSMLDGFPFR
jgi:hypothetical protein